MKTKALQWLAIILIIETGLLHLIHAQHAYEEVAYLGYLFVLNFLGALLAAYGIYREKMWGWWLGIGIATGSIAGYLWSRTLGLPGAEVEEWLYSSGVLAVGMECLYLLVMLLRPWKMAVSNIEGKLPSLFHHLAPASTMFLMVLIAGFAYQLGGDLGHSAHKEVALLEVLQSTTPMSSAEFEQKYGMRVTLVGISMLESIVDVRVKVIDPIKADAILDSQSALLVDQQALVLAPHMHNHTKVKPGQIYVIFFPTQSNTVHVGSEVSLVFGDVHVESVIAR